MAKKSTKKTTNKVTESLNFYSPVTRKPDKNMVTIPERTKYDKDFFISNSKSKGSFGKSGRKLDSLKKKR